MARGSNSRDGRTARSELGREDRRDLDGEPRSSGRISDRLLNSHKMEPRNIGSSLPITGDMRRYAQRVVKAIVALNEWNPNDESFTEDRSFFEKEYEKAAMALENVTQGKKPNDGFGALGSFLLDGDKAGADTSWTHATAILGYDSELPKTNKMVESLSGRGEGRVARSEDTRSPGQKAAGEAHSKHMRMNSLVKLIEYFPPGNPRHEESKAEYLRLKKESEAIRNGITDKEWRKEVNFYLRTVKKPIDRTGRSMLG